MAMERRQRHSTLRPAARIVLDDSCATVHGLAEVAEPLVQCQVRDFESLHPNDVAGEGLPDYLTIDFYRVDWRNRLQVFPGLVPFVRDGSEAAGLRVEVEDLRQFRPNWHTTPRYSRRRHRDRELVKTVPAAKSRGVSPCMWTRAAS